VPTDTKAYMRYAISAQQAGDYISMVKNIKPRFPQSRNPKAISDFYTELIHSYDCEKLLQVIVSLTVKKRETARRNKTLNQTQTSFLKRAQEMIYNEFAFALNKTSDEVQAMIENEIA